MIRLKASDGEVRVFDDADTAPVPIGKPDVYWAASNLYRVWLSQRDIAKICANKQLMERASDG